MPDTASPSSLETPVLSPESPARPLRISHSQLASWNRCRLQWWLGYVEKWTPRKIKSVLEVGTLGHDWLRKHYLGTLDIKEELSKITFVIDDAEKDENRITTVALASNLITKYVNYYAPVADADWEVLEVEKHFEIPLKTPWGTPFILEGYVDLIIRLYGKIWVVDHKLTSRFWTPIQAMMDSQTPIYAASLRHLGVDVFGLIINQLNTYPYKKYDEVPPEKLFKREESHRTVNEMDNIMLELYKQVEDIAANREKIRRNLSKDCDRCFFQDPCQLNLKGIPLAHVMSDDFVKKGRG